VPGTLHKAVQALAIEPLSMALSVTGRKAYDVMIWLAQRGSPGPDGGYASPVSTILQGFGSSTKASERVQRYIEQMVQTTVIWRPLSPGDAESLTLEGFEAPAGGGQPRRGAQVDLPRRGDEARTFPLLAEARLYKRSGEWWVTWYYPPSIAEQIIDPDRWAQIELNSIARLSTYTAVALYEICARYKDSPGGLTSRMQPDHWTSVLREGGGLKPREFRKFKSELLQPAMREINERTELTVELIEHRRGAVLESVQFRVARRPAAAAAPVAVEPVDVTVPMQAASLGIRESELDPLLLKFGAARVTEALDALAAHMAGQRGGPVRRPAAYLATMLARRQPAAPVVPTPVNAAEVAVAQRRDPARELQQQVDAWRAQRLREVRDEFAAEPDHVRADVIAAVRQNHQLLASTPAVRRRLDAGEWESPLVSHVVLDAYASARHGPHWREPAELDLVLSGVQAERRR
jgi:hypothetical protein